MVVPNCDNGGHALSSPPRQEPPASDAAGPEVPSQTSPSNNNLIMPYTAVRRMTETNIHRIYHQESALTGISPEHLDGARHSRSKKEDLLKIMMKAFSAVNDLVFDQCAACGDDDATYFKGRLGSQDFTPTYDDGTATMDSTIQTETIHGFDASGWRSQYNNMHECPGQVLQDGKARPEEFPDCQTLESTLPSVASPVESYAKGRALEATSSSNEVVLQRSQDVAPARPRSQSLVPKKTNSGVKKIASHTNTSITRATSPKRSRSVPPVAVKVTKRKPSNRQASRKTEKEGTRMKRPSKRPMTPTKRGRSRTALRGRHRTLPIETKSSHERKSGGGGVFQRLRGRSPTKKHAKHQTKPQVMSQRRGRRTKTPAKKIKSNMAPKDISREVFSTEERTDEEYACRDEEDNHFDDNPAVNGEDREQREPPPDHPVMLLKEQIVEELQDHFSSGSLELTTHDATLRKASTGFAAEPKGLSKTVSPKESMSTKKTAATSAKMKRMGRGLFGWRRAARLRAVDAAAELVVADAASEDDNQIETKGRGEFSVDLDVSSKGRSTFLSDLQMEEISSRGCRKNIKKDGHAIAFPVPNSEGQELALDDEDHHYEDPANVHSMLTMPSFVSKAHLEAMGKSGATPLDSETQAIDSTWSDAPTDIAWQSSVGGIGRSKNCQVPSEPVGQMEDFYTAQIHTPHL